MTTSLYSCRSMGEDLLFAVTKFDSDLNPEATYAVSPRECDCPAGHKHTCRHRKMLREFINLRHINDGWFLNWDTRQWVKPVGLPEATLLSPQTTIEDPSNAGAGAMTTAPASAESVIAPSPAPGEGGVAKPASPSPASPKAAFRRRI